VRTRINLRGHEDQAEDYEFFGRWLHESWATPDPAARPTPPVGADPVPLLTREALAQLTAFWVAFQQEPDSIRTTARWAHLREVTVTVGEERPSVVLVDMPALAAQYPSVAAALKQAGLTAQQHDAYRIALISGIVTKAELAGAVEPTSVVGKNIAFLGAHQEELKALEATRIWRTP
jgi:hypothetical protein